MALIISVCVEDPHESLVSPKKCIPASFDTVAAITTLVVGILGLTSVIKMPLAASYACLSIGGASIFGIILLACVDARNASKARRERAEEEQAAETKAEAEAEASKRRLWREELFWRGPNERERALLAKAEEERLQGIAAKARAEKKQAQKAAARAEYKRAQQATAPRAKQDREWKTTVLAILEQNQQAAARSEQKEDPVAAACAEADRIWEATRQEKKAAARAEKERAQKAAACAEQEQGGAAIPLLLRHGDVAFNTDANKTHAIPIEGKGRPHGPRSSHRRSPSSSPPNIGT